MRWFVSKWSIPKIHRFDRIIDHVDLNFVDLDRINKIEDWRVEKCDELLDTPLK